MSPTYFCPATGSFASIGLLLCSASVFLDFSWHVHSDYCGSENFLTFIDLVESMFKAHVSCWNPKKDDWPKLKIQCSLDMNRYNFTDITETFPPF